MPEQSLTALLEALILAAARPVSVRELAAASELSEADTELALSELRQSVNRNCRGIVLREVAGGAAVLYSIGVQTLCTASTPTARKAAPKPSSVGNTSYYCLPPTDYQDGDRASAGGCAGGYSASHFARARFCY